MTRAVTYGGHLAVDQIVRRQLRLLTTNALVSRANLVRVCEDTRKCSCTVDMMRVAGYYTYVKRADGWHIRLTDAGRAFAADRFLE